MPCLRQISEAVRPLARSRSASRSNRATSSAVLRLLMSPSVTQSTERLPFRLDQILGSRPYRSAPPPPLKEVTANKPLKKLPIGDVVCRKSFEKQELFVQQRLFQVQALQVEHRLGHSAGARLVNPQHAVHAFDATP